MFAYLVINFPLGASIKLFFVGYCAAGHSNRDNTAVARSKRKPLCGLESGVSLCVCAAFAFLCVSLSFHLLSGSVRCAPGSVEKLLL